MRESDRAIAWPLSPIAAMTALGAGTQLYVRYAYQNQETQPGTNANSPYAGYDTNFVNKNHNILGSVTHVFSNNFTTQTKLVWNRLYGDQPLNGDPQPTLYMNPADMEARGIVDDTAFAVGARAVGARPHSTEPTRNTPIPSSCATARHASARAASDGSGSPRSTRRRPCRSREG